MSFKIDEIILQYCYKFIKNIKNSLKMSILFKKSVIIYMILCQ